MEGTYGIGNFGDDLLLKITHAFLSRAGHKVIIAGRTGADLATDVPRVMVGRLHPLAKARAIYRADAVVVGGGGQFNDNSSRTGGAHLVLTFLLAICLRKPIFVVATGFGPLRGRLSRALWLVLGRYRKATFAFREKIAVKTFRELTGREAALVGDLAVSGVGREMIWALAGKTNASNGVLVNFRNFRRNETVEAMIIDELRTIGRDVEGLSADCHGDLGARDLARHGVETLRPYRGVAPLLTDIAVASLVVTQRFHVLCACALLGVPVVPLVYAEKMRDFCEWVRLPYLTTEETDPNKIQQVVHAALIAGPIDFSLFADRIDPLAWLEEAAWKN